MNFQLLMEKINEFGQKAKILEKSENAHEIQKKIASLCSGASQRNLKIKISVRNLKIKIVARKLKVKVNFRFNFSKNYGGNLIAFIDVSLLRPPHPRAHSREGRHFLLRVFILFEILH